MVVWFDIVQVIVYWGRYSIIMFNVPILSLRVVLVEVVQGKSTHGLVSDVITARLPK